MRYVSIKANISSTYWIFLHPHFHIIFFRHLLCSLTHLLTYSTSRNEKAFLSSPLNSFSLFSLSFVSINILLLGAIFLARKKWKEEISIFHSFILFNTHTIISCIRRPVLNIAKDKITVHSFSHFLQRTRKK
jgi:hypothetical protein